MSSNVNRLKDFYTIADFYNFIKNPENSVAPQRLFSIVPFVAQDGSAIPNTVIEQDGELFSRSNLERFSLAVQYIELPNFSMSQGNIQSSYTVDTPIGAWRGINNTTSFVSSNEIKFHLLEMQDPIIENWIFEWYMACLQTKCGNGNNDTANKKYYMYPFPRLNLAIKYYRMDQMIPSKIYDYEEYEEEEMEKMVKTIKPTFIYWITGAYPDDMETFKYKHGEADAGSVMRSVTFAFNMMICITEKTAATYKLSELFKNGVELDTQIIKDNAPIYTHFPKKYTDKKKELSKKSENIKHYVYDIYAKSNSNNGNGNNLLGKLLDKFVDFRRRI